MAFMTHDEFKAAATRGDQRPVIGGKGTPTPTTAIFDPTNLSGRIKNLKRSPKATPVK